MRAFIAVEIDHQAKQKISELILQLKKSNADVKWVTEDQMHFTLKFLGNIDKDKVRGISDSISSVSDNFNSFKIAFSRIGAFPSLNHPAVIWLGIDKGAESLKMLNEKIEAALEKSGFERESREFKPHLTLGRVRSDKNMLGLTKLLKETAFCLRNDVQINKLTLFQSNLSPKGATYSILLQKYLQNI
ncbi:MAG: 2'-5' RNA ligase [Candidatus Omnitrophica bacterium CG1_02_40_15]|nr:MAG: 2'-5' RNA ligase [Candidatus Omnitrophica bacterium CG1_02_40_15]